MGDGNESTAKDTLSVVKDEYIVTETTIVGVTESGIVRKRSVKRRVSRDETHKERPYGHDKDDYTQMTSRLMQERAASNALEMLQERWRMIMFMYDDCMDLVHQWEDQRIEKKERRRKRRMMFLSLLGVPVLILFLTSLVTKIWW